MAFRFFIIRFIGQANSCSAGQIPHLLWNLQLCCHVQKGPRHRSLPHARLMQHVRPRPVSLNSWDLLSDIFYFIALGSYSNAQKVESNPWSSVLAFHPRSLLIDSGLRSILILSFYLRFGQRSGIFSRGLSTKILCKDILVLVHAMKVYRGSKGVSPLIVNVGTSWRWVISFTPLPPYPREKSPRYPFSTVSMYVCPCKQSNTQYVWDLRGGILQCDDRQGDGCLPQCGGTAHVPPLPSRLQRWRSAK